MFFSLNKKFLYTVAIFFLFTAILFVYTFYIAYGNKIQEEQKSTILRNQQYLELLYENITLRKELEALIHNNPDLPLSSPLQKYFQDDEHIQDKQDELSIEQKRAAKIVKNYDERYEAIRQGIKIVFSSAFLIILSMLLIWYLMKKWVLTPINNLSAVSKLVSAGNFSSRVETEKDTVFPDELDELTFTFNRMLDNIENNIKEIKNQETFLQSIIDSIPDGIRVIDSNADIIIANKEYYRQCGSSDCINKKCYYSSQNRNTPCPHSMFTCPLHEIKVNHAKNVKVIQQFAHLPNRHLAINAAPLFMENEKGKELYIVESIRDLSEDIRFSHQQKLSSLGFLATSVAHEMKNHLGSIRMIIEGLLSKYYRKENAPEEEKKYLELINSQLSECINVPERLLKLGQYSSEEQMNVNCGDCIKDVLSLLDYEAKHGGIEILLELPPEDVFIRGSEGDFKMALINLTQNAFKAMPDGGKLRLSLKAEPSGKATIEIADNGIGIPKANLNRIFEPFFSEGKNSRTKGTGLGLSIVKSIIDKFKGTITVSSHEHQGTCFTLKFPISKK